MSNNTAAPNIPPKSRTKIIIGILSLLILFLIYGAGVILLPLSVVANFHGRDCDSVLSLNKLYTGLYPGFMEDKTLPPLVNECDAYVLASSKEGEENWREAYDAYQLYTETYPNGLYRQEVHEHSAIVLMNIVKDQSEQKEYEQALANLDQIISAYSDIGVTEEAWALIPATYVSWGSELRASEDFEGAVNVFNCFRNRSQEEQKNEQELDARRELSQTYLEWGQSLQSQKQYEIALAKFDLALSVDPESSFDSSMEVKAGQRSTYMNWGKTLLEHADFPEAIEKFEQAVSLSDADDKDGTRDALANGHIQWALGLKGDEDFLGALDKMDLAENTAVSDEMKRSVGTALGEIYLAFSNSTGRQAQQVMKEALEIVCEKNDTPDLPIFGLDQDSIRVGLDGIEEKLPEHLTARTPGEMHYIACVRQEERTIDSESRYSLARLPGGSYISFFVWQYRIKTYWHISLRNVETVVEYAATTLDGGAPPPFPERRSEWGEGRFYGEPPSMNRLVEWLQSVIK